MIPSRAEVMSDDDYAISAIVFDNGSGWLKAGVAGRDTPSVLPAVVGRNRQHQRGTPLPMGQRECYVGEEAIAKSDFLELNYPIKRGIGE